MHLIGACRSLAQSFVVVAIILTFFDLCLRFFCSCNCSIVTRPVKTSASQNEITCTQDFFLHTLTHPTTRATTNKQTHTHAQVAEGGFDDARNKYKARTADADAEERKAARVASIEQLKEQLAGDCSSAGSSGNRPPSSAAAAATAALSAESLSSSSAEGVSAAATTGESSGGGGGGGGGGGAGLSPTIVLGDFANHTLTGRSVDVLNSLSALFGDRKKKTAEAAAASLLAEGGTRRRVSTNHAPGLEGGPLF